MSTFSDPARQRFDIIIIGAGAAGCVLANRLSADPARRALLLEAGGHDRSVWWFRVPVGYRYTMGNPEADWCFVSEPERGLGGRQLKHPRGKVLGGSSAINGMVVIRGQAEDCDSRRDAGLDGSGWRDVLPYFIRSERHFAGGNDLHGDAGAWQVLRQSVPRRQSRNADCFRADRRCSLVARKGGAFAGSLPRSGGLTSLPSLVEASFPGMKPGSTNPMAHSKAAT